MEEYEIQMPEIPSGALKGCVPISFCLLRVFKMIMSTDELQHSTKESHTQDLIRCPKTETSNTVVIIQSRHSPEFAAFTKIQTTLQLDKKLHAALLRVLTMHAASPR